MMSKHYRNDSINPPGAYLSETTLGMGAYSRGAYYRVATDLRSQDKTPLFGKSQEKSGFESSWSGKVRKNFFQ